jgi:hypothetical protein
MDSEEKTESAEIIEAVPREIVPYATLNPSGGRPYKFSPERMIKALEIAEGSPTAAAKILRTNRTTVQRYIRLNPEVAAAYKQIKESTIDYVEGKLMENIKDRKEASIFFYLKTQAKHRGYIERSEVASVNLDLNSLTDEQLQRIVNGDNIYDILSEDSGRSPIGTPKPEEPTDS